MPKKSDILKESIIEAQQLREMAEKKAKQAILEDLAPIIKKTIGKELSSHFNFMNEAEADPFAVDETPEAQPAPAGGTPIPNEQNAEPVEAPVDAAPELPPATSSEVPITPAGGDTGEQINVAMPGPDGMITVSVDDLFTNPEGVAASAEAAIETPVEAAPAQPEATPATEQAPEATEEQPAPVEAQPQMESVKKKVGKVIYEMAANAVSVSKVSNAQYEQAKYGFFAIMEHLDKLLENKAISKSEHKAAEKKIEKINDLLREKLEVVQDKSIYSQNGVTMADNIRQKLRALFAEGADIDLDLGKKDAAGARIDAASKETLKDLKGTKEEFYTEPTTDEIEADVDEGEWEKIFESAENPSSESTDGHDVDEGADEVPMSKEELEEAVAIYKAMKRLNLNEDFSEMGDEEPVADVSADEPVVDHGEASDEDFDLEAALSELEAELQDAGYEVEDFDLTVEPEEGGEEHFELNPHGEIEATDGEVEAPVEEAPIAAESKIRKLKAALAEAVQKNQEQELYNYKNVCLNKLLMSEAISSKDEKKRAIIALDKGNTKVAVEKIYKNILARKLMEQRTAKIGEAQKPAAKGNIVSESVNRGAEKQGEDPVIARWQKLARVKK